MQPLEGPKEGPNDGACGDQPHGSDLFGPGAAAAVPLDSESGALASRQQRPERNAAPEAAAAVAVPTAPEPDTWPLKFQRSRRIGQPEDITHLKSAASRKSTKRRVSPTSQPDALPQDRAHGTWPRRVDANERMVKAAPTCTHQRVRGLRKWVH